ncbi:MAG TPA: hypothetical protein VLW53_16445 [Candidatus Eisenbacteria bacterium]|nr:hypothetical protein [Candidatus Eisenbacteria bacterium]
MADSITQRYLDEVAARPETLPLLRQLSAGSPLLHVIPFYGRLLLTPMFLSGEEKAGLERDLLGVYRLLESLPGRLSGGDLRRHAGAVGLAPAEADLAVRMAAPWPPPLIARGDLYRTAGGFKLLELNVGSPVGGYQSAELNRVMMRADVVREFVERERLRYADALVTAAGLLQRRFAAAGGGPSPVVALTEWPSSFAMWEPMLRSFADQLGDLGFDFRPCHVGQLREERGRLTMDGAPVDIVFRHFTTSEVMETPGGLAMVEPLVRAHERGVAEMFVPLSTQLLGSKVALALLSDERHRDAFTSAELELIDRFLPWTRRLAERRVHFQGVDVDLLDLCRASKDRLVIKAGGLFGGHGVHTGWTMSEREWSDALEAARGGSFVVQERIVPAMEPVPNAATGELEPWIMNWGVFVTEAGYGGCYLRGSPRPDDGVVNLTNGAWNGSAFYQEP